MNQTITRDGDIITIVSEKVTTIDLAPIRAEIAELQSQEEPSDAEVLAKGVLAINADPSNSQNDVFV